MTKTDVDDSGRFVLAKLPGDLNTESGETFSRSLPEHVSSPLLPDLSALELIASSGLGAIINLVARARSGGGNILLVSPSAFVQGVFATTRIDKWFDISATLEGAVARLRRAHTFGSSSVAYLSKRYGDRTAQAMWPKCLQSRPTIP